MSNLKPSLSLRGQVDVIEFYLKEKIFGDRCRTSRARGSARSENSSGEQFGVASRAITPWIRDGSLIAAHNMLSYGLLCPESHNTITIL